MLFFSIAHDYFLWHYSRAFREIFHVWLNFLWFVIHLFSLPQLAKSWFAPFRRITEERRRGFDFEDIAGYVVINLLSRLVGAFMRSIIIGLGLVVLVLVIVLGALLHLLWFTIPALLIGGLVSGISLLFL